MEFYPHLPGYRTTLTDGNLRFAPPDPATDSVLIIGTASDGPTNEPQRLRTLRDVEEMFGRATSVDDALVLAWQEAIGAGCEDVRLMRLSGGSKASVMLTVGDGTPVDAIKVEGKYDGVYDGAKVEVNVETVEFTIPSFHGVGTLVYNLNTDATTPEPKTLKEFCDEVNEDESNNFFLLSVEADDDDTVDDLDDETFELTGGSNGPTSASDRQNAMETAYGLLQDYDMDIVVPISVYANEEDGNENMGGFAQQLAEFCFQVSDRNKIAIGMISTSPIDGEATLASVQSYVASIKALQHEYLAVVDVNMIDIGRHISVVVGEGEFRDLTRGVMSMYTRPLAVAYAGLTSTLPGHSATTNKILQNVRRLRYVLSLRQMDDLTARRFVTFRRRVGRGIAATDGVTSARSDSDWVRLSTMRIVKDVTSALVVATDPFIGEGMNLVQRNALNTAIQDTLDNLQEVGSINQFMFTIRQTPQMMVRGECDVDLELVPAFELRKIRTTITLRAEL